MSDYVRKKVVRFKIPKNIIEELKKENEDWLRDLLLEKYELKEDEIIVYEDKEKLYKVICEMMNNIRKDEG